MDKKDWIILYLSLCLTVFQYLYAKELRGSAYYQGRSEILEIMAELTDTGPYVAPKKGK